jgi:hypothetical protein
LVVVPDPVARHVIVALALALASTACTAHVSVSGRSRIARDLGIVTRDSCEMDELLARVGRCVALPGRVEAAPGLDAVSAGAAFDGDVCRSWNGGPNGDGRWIGLDLGAPQHIDGILLVARHGGSATHVVDVSNDGTTFTTAVVLTGEIAMDQAWALKVDPTTARWVRVTTTGSSAGAPSWREVSVLDCAP